MCLVASIAASSIRRQDVGMVRCTLQFIRYICTNEAFLVVYGTGNEDSQACIAWVSPKRLDLVSKISQSTVLTVKISPRVQTRLSWTAFNLRV